MERVEAMRQKVNRFSQALGNLLVDVFHQLALFVIGGATVWSAVFAFLGMTSKGHASIDDILLLFIYLELGAMVGIYFKTSHMPVRFLIYVGITALTRMLIADIQHDHTPDMGIILVSSGILLLTVATLVIRFGSARFPSVESRGG